MDVDIIKDMLARANQYYAIVVHEGGSTIACGGSRQNPLPRQRDVRFTFDKDGALVDVKQGGLTDGLY